ncbi:hypothetical protein N7466_006364 [Penicillium verhagenii]|uniref:uncharacterized protein n=1 Tax=Penicillium verhagenii TaxID=1562060 RepID=UPI002545AA2A|nr:uncharacterized protein N7466_006364 [Penicillium verhagenii]KAJ5930871.1 hypothetical protein N7466_006364 [Penicillium verhagenii]
MDTLRLSGLHTLTTSIFHALTARNEVDQLEEIFPFLHSGPGLKHLCISDWELVYLSEVHPLTSMYEPKPICQLESVTLPTSTSVGNQNFLCKLVATGNLSQLRSLDIGSLGDARILVSVAGLFPNLKRLFISLDARMWNFEKYKHCKSLFFQDSTAGILAFRPLEYLSIKGLDSVENLNSIIQHHGPSLKGLALVPHDIIYEYPRLHLSDLLEMAILCPNLEELRLQIKRSMGSQEECEMYKAFGTFPNLQILFLDLDFDARSRLPSPPNFETENLDDLRQTFINAAMDEKLAFQIWKTIKNKDSGLRDLRLLPFGNRVFAHEERLLICCFARSWLLTSYNLEYPGLLVIEQIGKRAWEVKRAKKYPDWEPCLTERMASVVHNIWPQVPGYSDWWTCWTSLPLQPDDCLPDEH